MKNNKTLELFASLDFLMRGLFINYVNSVLGFFYHLFPSPVSMVLYWIFQRNSTTHKPPISSLSSLTSFTNAPISQHHYFCTLKPPREFPFHLFLFISLILENFRASNHFELTNRLKKPAALSSVFSIKFHWKSIDSKRQQCTVEKSLWNKKLTRRGKKCHRWNVYCSGKTWKQSHKWKQKVRKKVWLVQIQQPKKQKYTFKEK